MAGKAVASARLLAGLLTLVLVVAAPARADGLVSHVDAQEVPGGPLDLTDVVFGQDGTDMVLRLATAGAWSSAELSSPTGGSLCVLLLYAVPRRPGRICVAGQDGETFLKYARVDPAGPLVRERVMTASVSRPTGRSVLATFSPAEAGLEPRHHYAWRAESSWPVGDACVAPPGCVDRVPQRRDVAATLAAPPPPDQLAVLPARVDARDVAGPTLDLAAVTFGQRGADMALQMVASQAWGASDLSRQALCVRLFDGQFDAPRARICVVDRSGKPALTYTRVDPAGRASSVRPMVARVRRPARRSVWATFSPGAAGLRPGWFSWQAESSWSDAVTCPAPASCTDRVPNAGAVLARITPPPPRCFGAAARDPRHPCRNPDLRLKVVPRPLDALIEPNAPCTPIERVGLVSVCGFGIDPAVRSLALIGDSHAEHWRAAVQAVAEAKGRRGVSLTHASCPLTTAVTELLEPARSECVRWNREVPRWLSRHPAVSTVFVSENTDALIAPTEQVTGYMGAWKALPSSVRHVIVIRDSAHRAPAAAACIRRAMARHRRAGVVCAAPRRTVLASDPAVEAAARLGSRRVRVVDLTRFMCSSRLCSPVIGGALVHKDGTHLTAVFARTLGPYLLREVDRVI